MRYLTFDEILELHRLVLEQAGDAAGMRDLAAQESAVAPPYMAFGVEGLSWSRAKPRAAIPKS